MKELRIEKVKRVKGKNLYSTMSGQLAHTVYDEILELPANSYDSDAREVKIIYKPNELLRIEDNGLGMDHSGVLSFLRVGDSNKVLEPFTPSGRRKIGKFGIATILLADLAKEYSLETISNGELRRLSERAEDIDKDLEYDVPVFTAPKGKKGTIIELKGLKFGSETGFKIEQLMTKIGWELPIGTELEPGDEFNITVNGNKVVNRIIENAIEYKIDEEVPKVSRVHGSIYYSLSSRAKDLSGIYLFVHKRAYGAESILTKRELATLSFLFRDRIIGRIHADGLDDLITFNRSQIKEGDPRIVETKKAIKKYLYSIRYDIEKEKERTKTRRHWKNIQDACKYVTELLNENKKELEINSDISILLTDSNRAGIFSTFNDGVININRANPSFSLASTTDYENMKYYISQVAIDALAKKNINKIKEFEDRKERITNILMPSGKSIFNILEETYNKNLKIEFEKRLSPHRVYTPTDIQDLLGKSNVVVGRLIEAKALKPYRLKRFLADNIAEVKEDIQGYTHLNDVVKNMSDVPPNTYQTKEKSIVLQIESWERKPKYLKNIGEGSASYWIETEKIPIFMQHLNDPSLKREKRRFNAKTEKTKTYVSMQGLVKELDLEAEIIATIIDNRKGSRNLIKSIEIGNTTAYDTAAVRFAAIEDGHIRGS